MTIKANIESDIEYGKRVLKQNNAEGNGPKCKGDLELTPEEDSLHCNACKLKYLIQDDIPIMLIDQAQPLP